MCTHSTCDQCGLPPWNRPPHSLVSDPESPDMSCPRRARGGAFLWARYPCRVALQKVTFQARFRAFPLYPSMFACFGTKQVPVDRKNSYGAFWFKDYAPKKNTFHKVCVQTPFGLFDFKLSRLHLYEDCLFKTCGRRNDSPQVLRVVLKANSR